MANGALSRWGSSPRLGLIGNPENRRIRDFQAVADELGLPRPPCLSYAELLRNPGSLERANFDLLRIDSPGENPLVSAALIALGGGPKRVEMVWGEIAYLREYHRGFCSVLAMIEACGVSCVNSPRDIRTMFDKWASHERFRENRLSRPASTMAPATFSILWEEMRAKPNGRLFLKPLHGSSASGVCALRWNRDRQQLIAPLRIESEHGRVVLVNSLDVRTYNSLVDIELILQTLLPQGMIREQWIPKLTLPGGAIDLRVLVIAGEARHWVARQSRHPMTNLHLGNARGDEAILRQIVGETNLSASFALAEKAAACFPESLYAGVDILLDSRHQPYIGEINAFGDLLPRLTHRGESAYQAIARGCHDLLCVA